MHCAGIMPLGIVTPGSITSSATLTICSKPIKA
jgi:hypothetical protein